MNWDEANFEDLLNQSEVKDYLHRAEAEMFPKMKGSALSLVISDGKFDAKLALEVGAAILFDKPLIILSFSGSKLPEALKRAATRIIEIDDFQSPETQKKIQRAVEEALKETHHEPSPPSPRP